jgi:hypothetical protein
MLDLGVDGSRSWLGGAMAEPVQMPKPRQTEEETKLHEKADVILKERKKENSYDDGNNVHDNAPGNTPVLCPRRGTHLAQYPWAEQEEDTDAAVHAAAAGLFSTL